MTGFKQIFKTYFECIKLIPLFVKKSIKFVTLIKLYRVLILVSKFPINFKKVVIKVFNINEKIYLYL